MDSLSMDSLSMDSLSIVIVFLIGFTVSVSANTAVNTNSVETPNITSTQSQLTIGSVTNFTSNPVKGVSNLFFSSTAYLVQNSDGDDMVFQLDNSSGTRNNFLRFDNSVLSANFSVPVDMGSNRITNLADPVDPQDAATLSWVNSNDNFEADTDTNASTECSAGQVLTGSGCDSQYTSSDDGDSSVGNEGVNGSSFDTSNGVLTLGREHRTSLTQDLDGRYPTSDTNTQLDDQVAQSNVDLNGNSLDNVGGLNGDCPSGYVWVPGSGKFGTLPGFCTMKYEAKDDGSGNAVSQASSSPWVNIEQYTARQECRSLGSGYHLVSEREWMTMAYQIANNPNNWADGNIGSKAANGGGLYMGNVAPPTSHSHLGYNGPNPESGTGRDTTARLQLENGNYVWDLSGNVWEWTSTRIYTLNGNHESPQQNGAAGDESWHELDEVTDWRGLSESRPPRVWNSSQGTGRIYLNGDNTYGADGEVYDRSAVRRGGHWNRGQAAGLFGMTLDNAPSGTFSSIGFRCSLSPVS